MAKVVIIGGGFFGMYIAEHFSRIGHNVILVEKDKDFMSRASYVNQARVHNGYHYPRSVLTALRSKASFPRFVNEFGSCISSEFEKYYLIGNSMSKVTARQFELFCDRVGVPYQRADHKLSNIINPSMIEASYSVVEYAFDSEKLKYLMLDRLKDAGVNFYLETEVTKVQPDNNRLKVSLSDSKTPESQVIDADHVFNCTYSGINLINKNSNIELIPMKHEMTEMCLVEMPDELKNTGMTVMCGPFFSFMPFPSENIHSFSHVRYTPHYEWRDDNSKKHIDNFKKLKHDQRNSAWDYMRKDAARFIPILNECKYEKSIWEVKTILPRSESDDSRPILFLPNYKYQGYHCIMGGKIDNVYDAIESIKNSILGGVNL